MSGSPGRPPLELVPVLRRLLSRCHDVYLVGGFLRDRLLHRSDGHDLDVSVEGDPRALARDLADVFGGSYVPLHERHSVARALLPGLGAGDMRPWQIDLARLEESVKVDAGRRDFTVNALLLPVSRWLDDPDPTILDPVGGVADLRQGRLRAVTPESFDADPVRLLRAVRLEAECGVVLDGFTAALVQEKRGLLMSAAAERARDELCRLLARDDAAAWLRRLDGLGLLTVLLPELEPARGCQQPKEHYWDVLDHLLETVASVTAILSQDPPPGLGPLWGGLAASYARPLSGGRPRAVALRLAALLHDVAKPACRTFEAGGRMRFFGHADMGADMARSIMQRLRFGGLECDLVERIVRHHLRPGQLADVQPISDRAIYRFFRDTEPAGADTLLLSLADHRAARGPLLDPAEYRRHEAAVADILTRREIHQRVVAPVRLATGEDVMRELGITAGRQVGKVLDGLLEAQAAGEVHDRPGALAFIRSFASPLARRADAVSVER
ncbi:MAG: HD domain-containing protein [Chloroflexi bacterium]|nr:HD domain-containing protein [Chloroflexota bacterium]